MAFLRFAKANSSTVRPCIPFQEWDAHRTAHKSSVRTASMSPNLIDQASQIFGKEFNPDSYLLTHATIIASVDTADVPNIKLGSVLENGFKVHRKFADYRVTSETDKYINNNMDCWSRRVLMASYPTFIGAHNFVEHVQVEDLSKGRIIDAVARDIGESIYVDILVATDKLHRDLVASIQNGRMATLSMGCTTDFTLCTKCGHLAVDETDMCPHIRYEKGNVFYDDQGGKHRVAELCGHPSVDPTGGVNFVEASWVASPAFTGAVLRNVLEPHEVSEQTLKQAQAILQNPPKKWDRDLQMKVAQKMAQWDEEEGGGGGGEEAPAKPELTPMEELESQIEQTILKKVQKRIKDQLQDKKVPNDTESTSAPNDTVIHQSMRVAEYRGGVKAIIRTASSKADFINRLATYNQHMGINIPVDVYRSALVAGPIQDRDLMNGYLQRCSKLAKREFSFTEKKALIRLGKLLCCLGLDKKE